jgi:hypothetical protein
VQEVVAKWPRRVSRIKNALKRNAELVTDGRTFAGVVISETKLEAAPTAVPAAPTQPGLSRPESIPVGSFIFLVRPLANTGGRNCSAFKGRIPFD